MKKIIIVTGLCILLSSNNLFSQDVDYSTNKHEFSFQVGELFNKDNIVINNGYFPAYNLCGTEPFYAYYPYSEIRINQTLFGIAYKYHFKKSAIRLTTLGKFSNSNEKKEPSYSTNGIYKTTVSNSVISTYLGYELQKNFQRTQLFYGIDIGFKYSEIVHKNEMSDFSSSYKSTYKYMEQNYQVASFIGIRIFISPRVSISTEVKFIYEHVITNTKQSFSNIYESDSWSSDDNSKLINNNFSLLPVGNISFNFHF